MTFQRKYILIWLLPLIVLRGLVPVGFMIDVSGNGLSMVICSGGVFKTVAVNDQSSEHQKQNHGDSICPFAVAAGGPASSALPVILNRYRADIVLGAVAVFHSPSGPTRVQQSRAPPYFSPSRA